MFYDVFGYFSNISIKFESTTENYFNPNEHIFAISMSLNYQKYNLPYFYLYCLICTALKSNFHTNIHTIFHTVYHTVERTEFLFSE